MTTTTTGSTAPPVRPADPPQYPLRHLAAVWLAATAPMSVLAWGLAPWAAHHLGVLVRHSRDPFIDALVIAFDLGLAWMLVLTLLLVRRERGSLRWAVVRDALWLNAPRDPRTGAGWRRVWPWAVLFTVLSVAVNALPLDPDGPLPRDFPLAILTDRIQDYFHGNWSALALMLFCTSASPVVEELLFRGWLLPRSRAAFGRAAVPVNAAMFALYHLHQPWSIPEAFLDGALNAAYPTRRFRSIWIGLITHGAPSVLIVVVLLDLVLH